MKNRLTAIAMTGALMSTFVLVPMVSVVAKPISRQLVAQTQTGKNLQNLPVTGSIQEDDDDDEGTFRGTVSITEFKYVNGQLLVSGVIIGRVTSDDETTKINKVFTDVPARLTDEVPPTLTDDDDEDDEDYRQKQLVCDILFLFVGPIFLDVLGLQVNLLPIVLDINAVSGPGNLLGNLLCALVGLLDEVPLRVTEIENTITQINDILPG